MEVEMGLNDGQSPSRQFVAEHALEAVSALGTPPPETVRRNLRWLNVDSHSYVAVFEFEDAIDRLGLPGDLSSDEREAVNGDLAEWHLALPFNESERRLILEEDAIANDPLILRRMIGRKAIFDRGEVREVTGRELIQRWWKWRRGVEQFEGGNGVERGRRALYRLAGRLIGADQLRPLEEM